VIRLFFGFHDVIGPVTFLAMGIAVGLFLASAILAQALLGKGMHAWTTAGWLVGLTGLAFGTALLGTAIGRATAGFLLGAVAAAGAFAILLAVALHKWDSPDAVNAVPEPGSQVSPNPTL
jgi:hypothetical protein